jgi:hypothetical protein
MATEAWQDEPPRRGRYDWGSITKRLRRRPEKWLLISEQTPRSVYGAIKRNRINALRDPDWYYDVRVSNTNGTKGDIWMSARPRTEEEKESWDSRL